MSTETPPAVVWEIYTLTNTEKKAREVFRRLSKGLEAETELISLKVDPEVAVGHLIRFNVLTQSIEWNDLVIECFRLGQRVASGWRLSGHIDSDPGGWSAQVSDSAVKTIQWSFQ